MQPRSSFVLPATLLLFCCSIQTTTAQVFDYKKYLSGSPSTLSAFIASLDSSTGTVTINGGESQPVVAPFSWEWGDGTNTSGFFPQAHTYADRTKNYVVKVTSHYAGSKTDFVEVSVRFQPLSAYAWPNAPAALAVTIPAVKPALGTRLYQPPNLSAFDNSFFQTISRPTVEAVLTVAAAVEMDFVNSDVYLYQNKFQQVMLRDANAGGAYSLWFTDPVAFGVGEALFRSTPDFSSLFHEMGHNFTLNSPANYYYGGRIDGNANAIFSEAVAQIFQHAAGYEIVNNQAAYGLPADLVFEIKTALIASIKSTRSFYEQYLSAEKLFASWNNPNTPTDETLPTFGTIAFKFMEHAENSGKGYRTPLKRMMQLLQVFNSALHAQYDQQRNTARADTFRATLMVTALSYAFDQDLRMEFRNLNFPISDTTYQLLLRMVMSTGVAARRETIPNEFALHQNYPNPFSLLGRGTFGSPSTMIKYDLPQTQRVTLQVYDINGRFIATLLNAQQQAPGQYLVSFNPTGLRSGVYFYRLQAGSYSQTRKLILMR